MKNYKPLQNPKIRDERIIKGNQNQIGSASQLSKNIQSKMVEFQTIAKKAKEQLKQLDSKRKYSPQVGKYRLDSQQTNVNNGLLLQAPNSAKSSQYSRGLTHNYSQKYFKNQNFLKDPKAQRPSELKVERISRDEGHTGQQDKNVNPSKKKELLSTNQYKKLHQKLDSIQNKITDMKKNLEKKREEKQKMIDNKLKNDKEGQLKKLSLNGLVTQVPQHAQLHSFNTNPYSPRHNVYYVSELVRAINDERSLAREHLVTSLNILKNLENSKRLSEEQVSKIRLNLSKRKNCQGKKTLVFDLDETLIHCNENTTMAYDVKLPIKFPTGEVIEAGINIRPYARQILKNLSRTFQIIVFTASHSCYANVVVDYLDPNKQWISHRLFRQHCFLSPQGLYVKDLRVINRDLKQLILVDNAAYSYAYQLENGVPILPYYHGNVDFELKMLEDYLSKMVLCKDIRQVNENTFKLTKYRHYYQNPEKLVDQLYLNK